MAPTVAITNRGRLDSYNVAFVNFTWDATYPAGGEAITANSVGMGTIIGVIPMGNPGGAVYAWDAANSKLLAFYADYNAAQDGLLIDIAVGDTAILDGVVVPLMVIGF